MKSGTLSMFGALAAPLILAGPAVAGFVGLKMVNKPNPYALTYNLYAQFDERPGDFVFAVAGTPISPLNVNVRGGTFYQTIGCSNSGDTAPNAAFFEVFPSMEFDTFVTIGRKTSIGDVTSLAPGWPGFGPDRLAGNSLGWFITPDDPQGNPNANNQVLLMQLSTQNGEGFFGTILVAGFSNGLDLGSIPGGADVNGYVSFDTQLAPAPGALALLGTAGLLGCGRRRRARGA